MRLPPPNLAQPLPLRLLLLSWFPTAAVPQQLRARAKTRVNDLQDMFSGLQYARKEPRSTDAVVLEAQLHQMFREWRAELSVPSPASSLQGNNQEPSDPPSETPLQLQLAAAKAEEEDDATSKLVEQQPPPPSPR